MKTILPVYIETEQEAKSFLDSLIANDEVFHPEDDAHEIVWTADVLPTPEEADKLNELMDQIYKLDLFDPCEYILSKTIYL